VELGVVAGCQAWWRIVPDDVRHRAVAQGLGVVVGVQPVLVILQRRSQLDWRS